MLGDEPPPHWKVRGAAVELKTDGQVRQLTTVRKESVELTSNLTQLPANFTVEIEIMWAPPMYNAQVYWYFGPKAGAKSLIVWVSTRSPDRGTTARGNITLRGDSGDLGSGDFEFDLTMPLALGLWMQNGRLRVYTNGDRIIDVNQVQLPKITAAWMELNPYDGPIGLRRLRIAESAPDFSAVISSSGRYVTHGIHFDTDSDSLKPDSGPVVKMVADALKKNPALKLLVEGHTDSTGEAQHNMGGIGVGPNAVNLRETPGPSHLGAIPAEEIPVVPIGILIFSPDPVFLIRDFSSDIVAGRGRTGAPVSTSLAVVHRIAQIVPR